jgi:hypothetical protein
MRQSNQGVAGRGDGWRVVSVILVLGFTPLTACADPEGPAAEGPPPGTPAEVAHDPALSLGVVAGDPDQEFHQVGVPFFLADGRVAVPLGSPPEIRLFDREGALTETLGREGEGPGEFTRLSAAWARGDTVEALDVQQARATRFLPDGELEVRAFEATEILYSGLPGRLPGAWVALTWSSLGPGGREELALRRFSLDGSHQEQLATLGGMIRVSGPAASGVHPLSPRVVLRAEGGHLYFADSWEPRIHRVTDEGAVEEFLAWEPGPVPGPREALEVVREALVERDDQRGGAEIAAHLLESDEEYPVSVFWDFQVDPAGYVWVLPFDPARHSLSLGDLGGPGVFQSGSYEAERWTVLDLEGQVVGEVALPGDFRIAELRGAELLGVRRDPVTGVEMVEVRRIQRR